MDYYSQRPSSFSFFFFFLILIFMGFLGSSLASEFVVGGKDGWIPNPSESYNHWAEKMRFQVDDTLVFNFRNGSDSVLQVNKQDYDNCSATNPLRSLKESPAVFKFDQSGPFFFISSNPCNCNKAQKLVVVVLASRSNPSPPPPPPKPSQSPRSSPPPENPPPAAQAPGSDSPSNGVPTPGGAPGSSGGPGASPGSITAVPSSSSSSPAFTGSVGVGIAACLALRNFVGWF